jgi:D-glycero-alpha-D-manno-heptose-7-phosphate kinase
MIVSKTPYRLSLFGGGTDYPVWYKENTCSLVTAAMNRYSHIFIKSLPPFFDHKTKITYSIIEKINQIEEIKHPSVRACLQYLNINDGLSIGYDGDLPANSGIGSSSSFTVGLLNALFTYKNIKQNKNTLAKEAIQVEHNILNEAVGIQDQIAAAYGGIILIKMNSDWHAKNLLLSQEYITELESHILLGYSNISRLSETQAKRKIDNIKEGSTLPYLKEISSIAYDAINNIVHESSIDSLGDLLNKNWQLKKNLAEGISSEWMDSLYNTGIKNGAFGGKLMGAGGGGFFYFLAPPRYHNKIKKALSSIKVWVPIKFCFEGSKILTLE